MIKSLLSALLLLTTANSSLAGPITPNEKKKVQEHFLQSIGGDLGAESIHINESQIDGLVEILIQGKMMYFDTESELLFIGEIYDKNGMSLTKQRLKEIHISRLRNLPPTTVVLNAGKGLRKIIEFSDPLCGYCNKAHSFFEENRSKLERHIYFDIKHHPEARARVIHILCSENKEAAFNAIYSGQQHEIKHCDQGEAEYALHQKASNEMSNRGTPTFYFGEELVRGFDRQKIAEILR